MQHDTVWTAAPKKIQTVRLRKILDLHGMTVHQAWNSVRDFLSMHHDIGTREVTVICGTGGQIAKELPLWCEQMHQVRRAAPIVDSHGQHGAFRVIMAKKT